MSDPSILAIGASSAPVDYAPPAVENPGALLDRDAFLKLLVAQLKYQDPTKPADASQMLAQSAQLTMVDRLNEIAKSFGAAAASDRMTLAATIVGKEVGFLDDTGAATVARVDSVRVDGDQVTLTAGAFSVPLELVTSISAPAAALAAAMPATGAAGEVWQVP